MIEDSPTALRSVYQTMITMIEAIAFEVLVSHAFEISTLSTDPWEIATSWAQVVATGLTIFLVWFAYSSASISIGWSLSIVSALAPFYFGIAQLVAIRLIGPESLVGWCYLAGFSYLFGIYAFRQIKSAALEDARLRSRADAAPWRALFVSMATVGAFAVAFGAFAQLVEPPGWVRFTILMVGTVALPWIAWKWLCVFLALQPEPAIVATG